MAAYPVSEYLGDDTYRLTDRFKAKIVRDQWLMLVMFPILCGTGITSSLIQLHLNSEGFLIRLFYFVMIAWFGVLFLLFTVAALYDRNYPNLLTRSWLNMTYRLEEKRIVLVASNQDEMGHDWSELSTIRRFPFSSLCLIFGSKERVFMGQSIHHDLETMDPLAKAIRDAVRHNGKEDLLARVEKRELRYISGLIKIPAYRFHFYAQTPALSAFLIGMLLWMFDGVTTAFYICMMFGVLSMPVMAVLVRIYRARTTKSVARFQEQLDEDKAGSTSLSDEK